MKNSKECPKCTSKAVYFIPEPLDRAYGIHGNSPMSLGLKSGFAYKGGGNLTAYACSNCGYVEFYMQKPEELKAGSNFAEELS